MSGSVSTHPVVCEVEAADAAGADRDTVVRCDQCERPGVEFYGGSWLCAACWSFAETMTRLLG